MTDALDDDLRARGAALRAEWRAEEEEWTRAAFEHWEHSRRLLDVARECMHRGDTVAIATSAGSVRGRVLGVGQDTLRVGADRAPVDVRVSPGTTVVLRVDAHARGGGVRGDEPSITFRARLLEHEVAGRTVELGVGVPARAVTGVVRVGVDHVRVIDRDGTPSYVSLAAIAWMRGLDDD
jgi:hypothetical protein